MGGVVVDIELADDILYRRSKLCRALVSLCYSFHRGELDMSCLILNLRECSNGGDYW